MNLRSSNLNSPTLATEFSLHYKANISTGFAYAFDDLHNVPNILVHTFSLNPYYTTGTICPALQNVVLTNRPHLLQNIQQSYNFILPFISTNPD